MSYDRTLPPGEWSSFHEDCCTVFVEHKHIWMPCSNILPGCQGSSSAVATSLPWSLLRETWICLLGCRPQVITCFCIYTCEGSIQPHSLRTSKRYPPTNQLGASAKGSQLLAGSFKPRLEQARQGRVRGPQTADSEWSTPRIAILVLPSVSLKSGSMSTRQSRRPSNGRLAMVHPQDCNSCSTQCVTEIRVDELILGQARLTRLVVLLF